MSKEEDIGRIIELNEDLLKDNEDLATINKNLLEKYKIKSFDVVGAIGAGKTEILERTVEKISKSKRIMVICGDITLRIDADRIQKHGGKTIQINTGRECALNAYHINKVINSIPLDEIDTTVSEDLKKALNSIKKRNRDAVNRPIVPVDTGYQY